MLDQDGDVYVADTTNNRIEIFDADGNFLSTFGKASQGNGELPGPFKSLTGVAIDKQNRVFTTEQEPRRLQVFRYVTEAQAAEEKTKQEVERQKAATRRQQLSQPQSRQMLLRKNLRIHQTRTAAHRHGHRGNKSAGLARLLLRSRCTTAV